MKDEFEDVGKEFNLLCFSGLVLCLVSALMYYMQAKPNFFELMRPYVFLSNLLFLSWFITLQYYRFKASGKACSADGHESRVNFLKD